MANLFNILISTPFYNGFIFLMDLLPFFDAGVIIIIFTIIVKLILLPLSIKASKAQLLMKNSEKDLKEIKEKYKDDKTEQSRKTMEYYKEKGINPFSGFFILIIQLPILIGLYRVFIKSGLPEINTSLLYSFIGIPTAVNMTFLHMVNIADKSAWLAYIAGATAYLQIDMANSNNVPAKDDNSAQAEFNRAMQTQMKYFFPILIGFVSYSISSAVALYIITSNVFAIAQEYYIRKKYHKSALVV